MFIDIVAYAFWFIRITLTVTNGSTFIERAPQKVKYISFVIGSEFLSL